MKRENGHTKNAFNTYNERVVYGWLCGWWRAKDLQVKQ
jgi:hypothetical protein